MSDRIAKCTGIHRHTDLSATLAWALRWQRMLDLGIFGTIDGLSKREQVNRGYMSRVLRLTLLAPQKHRSHLAHALRSIGFRSEELDPGALRTPNAHLQLGDCAALNFPMKSMVESCAPKSRSAQVRRKRASGERISGLVPAPR